MGRRGKPAKSKAEAKRRLARKPPRDDGAKVRDLEKRLAEALKLKLEALERERATGQALTEALEQQTATSEILRIISAGTANVDAVFELICHTAARLLSAASAGIFRFDGELLHRIGLTTGNLEAEKRFRAGYPRPPDPELASGRALLTRSTVQVPDTERDSEHQREVGRAFGFRRVLAVPMLRQDKLIGVLTVTGPEPGEYSRPQIQLLKTLVDQAVIAVENVRLFTELQTSNRELTTALDTQTATSDILRVISRSQTDVQPVFDAIVNSAQQLLRAHSTGVFLRVGDLVQVVGYTSTSAEGDTELRAHFPRPLVELIGDVPGVSRVWTHGELWHDPDSEGSSSGKDRRLAQARGFRSRLMAPLRRQDAVIGILVVTRRESGTFSADEIALLQTFADQAVIAIENVRLFTELQQKNEALMQAHAQVSQALEQQTATGDILRVISQSQTDVQPVFEAIADSAQRLCDAKHGNVFLFDGELIHLAAVVGSDAAGTEAVRRSFPQPASKVSATTRAILTLRPVVIPDVLDDSEYRLIEMVHTAEFRSTMSVPMLRVGEAIGAITVTRSEPGSFPEKQLALLQTFADQAVIAIENARLFRELEARTHDLTRSVGELRALGDVSQAISSTLDLQTVLSTIVARATELSGTDAGVIYEYDEQREVFLPRASQHLEAQVVETMLATPVRKGEGATGQLAQVHAEIQLPNILQAPAESRVRSTLVQAGYRALLAVPLLREDNLLGGLTVIRKAPGEFPPEVIELLRTFATQSALAIQNARLFQEIEVKGREVQAASQHKSEFLANMSHELRTPLNAIIGYSELLEEEAGDLGAGQLVPDLQKIAAAAKHQLSLINDVLDLSKVEAGRMELEVAAFDLPTAIDNCLTLVRERAARRGITLGSMIDRAAGAIRADERRVKQVLLNLLSNALKFTPEGGRIDIRAVTNGDLAEISVADTGVGIMAEDQEAVFEEFRQVGTADKKVGGTGLGLALSRKLIELHGGRIWVKSQIGMGSTFTFTIPVRREPGDRGGAPTLNS